MGRGRRGRWDGEGREIQEGAILMAAKPTDSMSEALRSLRSAMEAEAIGDLSLAEEEMASYVWNVTRHFREAGALDEDSAAAYWAIVKTVPEGIKESPEYNSVRMACELGKISAYLAVKLIQGMIRRTGSA
jgi:hypothetical protein